MSGMEKLESMDIIRTINISVDNLVEVYRCPCVVGIEKIAKEDGWSREGLLVFVRGLERPISENSCLIQDRDGTWWATDKDRYQWFLTYPKEYDRERLTSASCCSYLKGGPSLKEFRTPLMKDEEIHEVPSSSQSIANKIKDFWNRHNA